MWLFLCSQGRPTGQRTTSLRQLVWAWWWTRPALRLKQGSRLCRAKQRSSSSETGPLSTPARSLLTMKMKSALVGNTEGLLFNKGHCIVDEHLACSCHLNLILLMQNPLAVLCEWSLFYCPFPTSCLFFVHNCIFIFRFKTCYFYTLYCLDNCFTWAKAQGNSLCTIYFMPGAFCIFSWCQALMISCRT